jgi:glycosyltransferase involved in cell wall biosynthesis
MRVAFVTHSLETGGSERQVAALAKGLAEAGHDVAVVVLRPGGVLEAELRESGVRVVSLGTQDWYRPSGLRRITSVLRSLQPDVIHPYQSLPNVVMTFLRPFLGSATLVWGVRDAHVESTRQDPRAKSLSSASAVLSRFADLIIVNSEAGRRFHLRRGYPQHKLVVIENGIDTHKFRPNPVSRARIRQEWNVADDRHLVGLVARLHPVKGHRTFIEAAGIVAQRAPSIEFVCVGPHDGPERSALDHLARARGLQLRLRWSGERADMPAVYTALDVCCLSSTREGFPNVVAESMACGTPCVVTDVGDAAAIVDGAGTVVASPDPCALADGIESLLSRAEREGEELHESVRARIEKHYSVDRLVSRTVKVLEEAASKRRPLGV